MAPSAASDDATERSLAHYIELIRRRWVLVLVPAVVGALVGGFIAAGEPDEFRATAAVRVGDPALPGGLLGGGSDDIEQLLATSIEIISSDPIEERVLAEVSDAHAAAFESVSVDRIEDTVLVDIDVAASDPDAAQAIAQTWAEVYVALEIDRTAGALGARADEVRSQIESIESQLAEVNGAIADAAAELAAEAGEPVVVTGNETPELAGLTQERDELLAEQSRLRQQANELDVEATLRQSVVEVAFPADEARGPFGGRPVRTAAVAGLLGALLGAGLAVAWEELDDRIHDAGELEATERGIPILAAVPGSLRRGLAERTPVITLDADGNRAEAFRALRTNLEYILSGRPSRGRGRIVMVSSALNSEGKSTTAAMLATALVSLGRSVVLVDADLRRGRLHEQLGVSQSPGLVDVLVGDHAPDTTLQPVELKEGHFLLLAGGGRHLSPGELLASPRFEQVIGDLAVVSDYVIIDAPPILAVSDALELGRVCDGMTMVVGAGRTRRPQLRKAIETVRQLDIAILGFVLNGVGKAPHYYEEYTQESPWRRLPAMALDYLRAEANGGRRIVDDGAAAESSDSLTSPDDVPAESEVSRNLNR